jgi:PadR family transcriptional regulator PadR
MTADGRARRPAPPADSSEQWHRCELRNYLGPCLLLLLDERPDHGYDLLARLRPMANALEDPGAVYRTLRQLERRGLVSSRWLPANGTRARRQYEVTDQGRQALRVSAAAMRDLRDTADRFLNRFEKLPQPTLRTRRT